MKGLQIERIMKCPICSRRIYRNSYYTERRRQKNSRITRMRGQNI